MRILILALLASSPVFAGENDVTLYAPAIQASIVLPESETGDPFFIKGSRNEYFRQELAAAQITVKDGCRQRVLIKEMVERPVSDERRNVYFFISQYLGTDDNNDLCQRFNYARRVEPEKLLELFGLTLEGVGADVKSPHTAYVTNYPKGPDDPIRVNIGRARLEVTVTDEPRILVTLLSVEKK